MTDPLAMARLLMGGQPQTAGTAFEPVTWQQQLQNYKGLEGQENAWRTAEGSPWKPAEPGPMAKMIGNALTSEGGQRFMDLANFIGPGPKMAMRGMVAARQEPKGIRAYHGSPHDFDRFDLSKIGTGEGAQAYGHGLYFAEAENVAKSYRDQLKSQAFNFDGKTMPRDQAVGALAARVREVMPGAKQPSSAAEMVANWTQNGMSPAQIESRIASGAWPDAMKDEIRTAAKVVQDSVKPNPGRMYEVNIKADPADFLDWDVPLSQQSEKVRAALEGMKSPNLAYETAKDRPTGLAVLNAIKNDTGKGADVASQRLRGAGIPGIRYKDQGSRGAEGGTSNYVVFDDKLIDIVKKYGLAALLMGGATGGGSNSGNAAP